MKARPPLRARVGAAAVVAYGIGQRAYAKGISLALSGAFASFGRRSVIQPPLRLGGVDRIAVGTGVMIGPGSWLQVIGDEHDGVAIEIGDGTSIVGHCVLSAASSIRLGRRVLIARNAYISDHSHAFQDVSRAVMDQGITGIAPVVVDDGAWLGENVVVGPGVRIGRGAVIGAGSVVLADVPDHCVAVGAPARVVRSFAEAELRGHTAVRRRMAAAMSVRSGSQARSRGGA
jgi:acetyltransferase-like isoleucine patch superfamily enzyme